MTDLELLQQHATHRDPRTFEELVSRHLNWVYSAALRQMQDAHLADDVTQEQLLRKVVRAMSAAEELRKAVASEFGENVAKQFGALGSGVSATDITNAPETINGAQAIVDLGQAGPGPLPLVKTGDTWKVSPSALQTMNVDGLTQWERKAPAIRKLAADIKAGKFQSPAELQKAMEGLMR